MRRYINQAGIDLIKSHEGCRLKAYQDSVGVWTIGYGHTGSDVHPDLEITQDAADSILASDLNRFEDGVCNLVTVDINDNQFSTLVSFSFNLGLHTLANSSLLKYVNESNFQAAADEFPKWCHAGGKVLQGLVSRRADERKLFLLDV